jgi:hypothetical protein
VIGGNEESTGIRYGVREEPLVEDVTVGVAMGVTCRKEGFIEQPNKQYRRSAKKPSDLPHRQV